MPARPLPNLLLQAFFDLGEDGWNDEFDLNMLKLSVLVQSGVSSKVAVEPAGPAAGLIILLDETNAAHPNALAVFDAGAWVYVTPNKGWLTYDQSEDVYLTFDGTVWSVLETGGGGIADAPADDKQYARKNNAWSEVAATGGGLSPYRFGAFFTRTPEADEVLLSHVVSDAFTLPANLVGSLVSVGTNPSAATSLSLRVNGAEIGTIAVSAAGAVEIVSAETAIQPGMVLSVVAPAASNGLANVAFTIRGAGTGGDFRYVSLTQAEYDALATKDETTFYFIAE